MEIAIVEDLQFDFETLREMLESCLAEQKTDCKLCWFQASEAFLENFSAEQYDLLFLDVLLGEGISGMDTARAVRRAGCRTPIVFITSERDYALEGYEVQAIDYLIKPYLRARIQAILTRVLNTLRLRRFLTVQTARETRRICLDELMWAQVQERFVNLYLESGETVRTNNTFEQFESKLPPLPAFQSCYRGIIVNLAYAEALQGNDFLLRDGQRVPVSRSKRAEMQKALSDYAIAMAREEMGL